VDDLLAIAKRLIDSGEEITLPTLMTELHQQYKNTLKLIREFNVAAPEMRLDMFERRTSTWPWNQFVPGKTFPVFKVVRRSPEPRHPLTPLPLPVRAGGIFLRVDAYTKEELLDIIIGQTAYTRDVAEDYLDWWEFIRVLKKVPWPVSAPTRPYDFYYVPWTDERRRIDVPKPYWNIMEFRAWLANRLGLTMEGAMLLEMRFRDGIRRTSLRRYAVPPELVTPFGLPVELHPPVAYMGALTWYSHAGQKSEAYIYKHELDVWSRLPDNMDEEEIREIFRDYYKDILQVLMYPELDDILDEWHDANFQVVEVEGQREDDGHWIQYYQGETQRDGDIDVVPVLLDHKVARPDEPYVEPEEYS